MEDIFLPFKKGGMNDIDLGEATASQPETSSQESSSVEVNSTSTQVMAVCAFARNNPFKDNEFFDTCNNWLFSPFFLQQYIDTVLRDWTRHTATALDSQLHKL